MGQSRTWFIRSFISIFFGLNLPTYAEDLCEPKLAQIPIDASVQLNLSKHAYESGDHKAALQYLIPIIAVDPHDYVALTLAGVNSLALSDPDQAIYYFTRAIHTEGSTAKNLANLFSAYYAKGDYQKALVVANEMERLFPQDHKSLSQKAKVLLALDRNEEALLTLKRILRRDRNDEFALGMKVRALIKLKKYEEALFVLEELSRLKPNSLIYLSMTAHVLAKLGRYDEALANTERELESDPNNIQSLSRKLHVLMNLKKYEESLVVLERLHVLQSDSLINLNIKAKALIQLRRYDEALLVSDAVLKMDPNNAYAVGMKAEALNALGRSKEALSILENRPEDDLVALGIKAQTLIRLRKYDEALQVLERQSSLEPDNMRNLGVKTQCLIYLGRVDEALSVARGMSTPFYRDFYSAKIFILKREFKAAISILSSLESSQAVLWTLAQAQYSNGEMRAASTTLIRLIQSSQGVDHFAIAALMKIETAGGSDGLKSPLVRALTKGLDISEIVRISKIDNEEFWNYDPGKVVEDYSWERNNFWSGLYDRPVNGATYRATK